MEREISVVFREGENHSAAFNYVCTSRESSRIMLVRDWVQQTADAFRLLHGKSRLVLIIRMIRSNV